MRTITGYKSPFISHYVPLRIKKCWSLIMPSERHERCTSPPIQRHHVEDVHEACTYCSYLRIDVSLNTLFIFVRYIPRRWNPPRGEVRSTGNHECAPAVMIYRGTLRSRMCACKRGCTRTRERRGGYYACQARQSTRRGLSPPDSVLITFFLSFFFYVNVREISLATMPGQVSPAYPTLKAIHHPGCTLTPVV